MNKIEKIQLFLKVVLLIMKVTLAVTLAYVTAVITNLYLGIFLGLILVSMSDVEALHDKLNAGSELLNMMKGFQK